MDGLSRGQNDGKVNGTEPRGKLILKLFFSCVKLAAALSGQYRNILAQTIRVPICTGYRTKNFTNTDMILSCLILPNFYVYAKFEY